MKVPKKKKNYKKICLSNSSYTIIQFGKDNESIQPNKNGSIEISLYFAYNIPFELEKKALKRLLKRNFTIKILPSINVTASYVNACLYDNKKSQGSNDQDEE